MSAKKEILEEIRSFRGQAGIYYYNLITGETWGYREKEPYLAASIVKLPLMAAILMWKARGETSFDERVMIREDQKIPGCGAVQHLDGDVTLTVRELCKLMITISDSCATNALFRHYGAEAVRKGFLELGMTGTQFNREYWDIEKENKGINNYFVPEEMGMLLKKIYDRTMVDEASSLWLENLLRQQQINHKMGGDFCRWNFQWLIKPEMRLIRPMMWGLFLRSSRLSFVLPLWGRICEPMRTSSAAQPDC